MPEENKNEITQEVVRRVTERSIDLTQKVCDLLAESKEKLHIALAAACHILLITYMQTEKKKDLKSYLALVEAHYRCFGDRMAEVAGRMKEENKAEGEND